MPWSPGPGPTSGDDEFQGRGIGETVSGGDGNDELYGFGGDDTLNGDAGNDRLVGGDGFDQIDGGAGNDLISQGEYVLGGTGNDTIVIGLSFAVSGGDGDDTVFLYGSRYTGDTVVGGLADQVYGDGGIDTIGFVDADLDTFNAASTFERYEGFGTSRVWGNGEDNVLDFSSLTAFGADTGGLIVDGGGGADTLRGADKADTLQGGAGNDRLVAGFGDTLAGGDGTDVGDLSKLSTGVVVTLAGSQAATISTLGGLQIGNLREIENLEGTTFADNLIGDSSANDLRGGDGNDILRGGAGNDLLSGGDGRDTVDYRYLSSNLGVSITMAYGEGATAYVSDPLEEGFREQEYVGAEIVLGGAGDDYLSGDNFDYDFFGGGGNDRLLGGVGVNRLDGEAGDDLLRGGAGNDSLTGGTGVDTADYSDKTVAVAITLAGASPVFAKVGGVNEDTLREIENLIGGIGNDTLLGDAADNKLTGGDGADFLRGGVGKDTLDGGSGVDVADYREKTTAVVVLLDGNDFAINTVGGAAEDLIVNVESVYGGSAGDTLSGDFANNTLAGFGGNDVLQGGGGKDTLIGGAGIDAADYREKSAAIAVTLNGATAAVVSVGGVAEDSVREIEYVYGGSASDVLTGDAAANFLNGFSGNDVLKGGGGNDLLYGGAGTDTVDYRDKTTAVSVTLNGATIVDVKVGGVVEDRINTIEVVYGGAAADVLVGDGGVNLFRGGGGADQLNGGGGVDAVDFRDKTAAVVLTLAGANAATATVGGVAEDVVRNIEQIYGGSANDLLVGDALANLLVGGGGADTLRGLGGADTLTGGAQADVFVYNALFESTVAATGRDTITDFQSGVDKIRLTLIDANTTAAGDQSFTVGALAAGVAGRLAITADGAGKWLVQGDVNGDGAADFALSVLSVPGSGAPVAGDFLL